MIHYKRDFFDFFPDQSSLKHFCDVINSTNADAFILMAHKAVQLFQVLQDQGYIDGRLKQKIIISSQALDFDCSYLAGKRIVIVDDIVISGTSIASAVNKLLRCGVAEEDIDIIALARDKDYQTMAFESDTGRNSLYCADTLDDAECINLSYLISRAFSFYGTPYNIDFPIYSAIDLRNNKVQLFFNDLLWRTENVTNIDQKAGDVKAYVLFPKQNVLNMLWKRLGVNLSDCAHMKIRAYVRKYPSGRFECSIVPMCLFHEIEGTDLTKLYAQYAPRANEICLDQNKLLIAQMRYLEFYIAHQLYLVFIEATSLSHPHLPTDASLRLLFGCNDSVKIRDFLNEEPPKTDATYYLQPSEEIDQEVVKEFLSHPIGEEMVSNIAKAESFDDLALNNWVNQIILAPFVWWYDTKEIIARKEMMFPVKHYIKDYKKIDNVLERLRSGFSLRTIQYLVSEDLSNNESRLFISLFLDHAIDRGIIVPTIFHNTARNYLCRAFRHGEDLPFGLADECRLAYFLGALCEYIPDINVQPSTEPSDNALSEIVFEKMIVLFYQMGMRKGGIFNRFLGFDNIKILKPFLSLHGAIQAFVDPQKLKELDIKKTHIYSEKDEHGNRYITWLTYWARENGLAWNPKDKDGKRTTNYLLNGTKISKYLEKNGRSCIDDDISSRISDIASMIAIWYNTMIQSGQRTMFKDDATALTSCANAHIFVSAIATELHYYNKFWLNQVKKALDGADSFEDIKLSLYDQDEDTRNTANTIQGLHSGREKVNWYHSGAAKEVVRKVSDILKNTGSNNWVSYWSHVRNTPEHPEARLDGYIKQAVSFLYFYSACNDCLMNKPFWQTGEKPPYYNDYQNMYMEASASVTLDLNCDWFSSLSAVASISDFTEKKNRFFKLVRRALKTSKDLVGNIEEYIEQRAPDYAISYVSSLIFEVSALNPNRVIEKIMEVWNSQTDLTQKTQLNIIEFPQPEKTTEYKRFGIFYGIGTNYDTDTIDYEKNGKYLLDVFSQLCEIFNAQAKRIRGILLPQIPTGRKFTHSTQRKIAEYVDAFTKRVVRELEPMYENAATHQLIVAITHSVQQDFLDYVDDQKWYEKRCPHDVNDDSQYAQIVSFYNPVNFEKLPIGRERIFRSTVMIDCCFSDGMGFLVKTKNKVVCVTCNHILKYYNKDTQTIITANSDQTKFELRPIKPICTSAINLEKLTAECEVAILEPLWYMNIPYDLDNIISIDELKASLGKFMDRTCRCCGCVNHSNRIWKDELAVIGPTDDGYYQMNDPKRNLREGCSGGIVVDDQEPIILGMHKGRIVDVYDNKNEKDVFPLLIPGAIIKKEIEKLEETCDE
mgnify:FL=1